jgi:hypothetical protein
VPVPLCSQSYGTTMAVFCPAECKRTSCSRTRWRRAQPDHQNRKASEVAVSPVPRRGTGPAAAGLVRLYLPAAGRRPHPGSPARQGARGDQGAGGSGPSYGRQPAALLMRLSPVRGRLDGDRPGRHLSWLRSAGPGRRQYPAGHAAGCRRGAVPGAANANVHALARRRHQCLRRRRPGKRVSRSSW